jgi:hypothetical protein
MCPVYHNPDPVDRPSRVPLGIVILAIAHTQYAPVPPLLPAPPVDLRVLLPKTQRQIAVQGKTAVLAIRRAVGCQHGPQTRESGARRGRPAGPGTGREGARRLGLGPCICGGCDMNTNQVAGFKDIGPKYIVECQASFRSCERPAFAPTLRYPSPIPSPTPLSNTPLQLPSPITLSDTPLNHPSPTPLSNNPSQMPPRPLLDNES